MSAWTLFPVLTRSTSISGTKSFHPANWWRFEVCAISTGGPVSNTGIGLAKQGMKVAFMAKIGSDEFGRLTLERLKEWADVKGLAISETEHSSYTVAIAPTGIDRIFFHHPGTNNTFSADDINYDLCESSKIFHLGYPPLMKSLFERDGEQLEAIFKRVKEHGATTSMDMALPDPNSEAGQVDWEKILKRILPHVDICHPSAEEALFMADRSKWKAVREKAAGGDLLDQLEGRDYSELSQKFLDWGAAMVTHKSGHRGFYLRTAGKEKLEKMGAAVPDSMEEWSNRELWAPAYRVDRIASATGSGDSSLAGFTTAYLKGLSPEECVAAGNALGYQNLQELDAISGIGDWEATQKIMAEKSLPRHEIRLSDGWSEDKEIPLAYGPNDKK
jgi:sugar/nucleoside kinase (ribokinase family)